MCSTKLEIVFEIKIRYESEVLALIIFVAPVVKFSAAYEYSIHFNTVRRKNIEKAYHVWN